MHLIDTHAHLYSSEFDQDIETIVERAIRQNVKQIYLPAIDSESHEKLIALYERFPDLMRPMMGLHPCSVTENPQVELDIAYTLLQSRKDWVAVGEIGLDFHWDITHKEQQISAFRTQIEWAIEADLPIVIHSRKSTYDCIEILKVYKGKLRGIFHCFSGSVEEAKEIVKLDFLLGIGGVVTYKNAGT
jgi:TatD DNase family protein